MTATAPDLRAFLFTDIVGSSLLWLDHQATMREAVAAHDAAIREAASRHGGDVFKTAGDAFFVSFRRPSEAVLAACEALLALSAQSWPKIGPLKVRAAIHVGTAQQRGGDYFGPALNRCARLLTLAHGGQLLVTASVAELLASEREVSAPLLRLGEHPLDDPRQSVSVCQVVIEGLPQNFPPLRSPAKPAEPLLAVLAFDNLSGDPEMTFFSDGVSEEIQQAVARGADLRVIGRTSSFHYRGADKAVRRVAAELKATHVLDGSVRRSGQRVRISAELIECGAETTLWSARFDRDLSDVFALQDEIAAAVAAALKVVFSPTPKAEPIDAAAYELYLKARAQLRGGFNDAGVVAEAAERLDRATSLAPRFARAWMLLAEARMHQLRVHGADQPYAAMRAVVVEAAETALRLDPRLGAVHTILAWLEPAGHYEQREALFKKALTVSPNDPEVIAAIAAFYISVGRIGEGLGYATQSFDLDPMDFMAANAYGCFLVGAGHYLESRDFWDRFLENWPDSPVILGNAMGFAAHAAEWDRYDRLVAVARERGLYKGGLRDIAQFYRNVRQEDPRYTEGFMQFIRDELERTGNVRENVLGSIYELGLTDEAFALIEQASFDYITDPEKLWRGAYNSGNILSPTLHAGLMSDPRFPRLCAKLGLIDYWLKTDRWPDCAEPGVLPYDFKVECRRLAAAP